MSAPQYSPPSSSGAADTSFAREKGSEDAITPAPAPAPQVISTGGQATTEEYVSEAQRAAQAGQLPFRWGECREVTSPAPCADTPQHPSTSPPS
jgi:hypothetical protein